MQLASVYFQRSRVAVEVLVRQELQPVDKNADHHDAAQRLGLAHQGQVAVVQVAHGGHEGGTAAARQGVAQVRDGVDDLHGWIHQARS